MSITVRIYVNDTVEIARIRIDNSAVHEDGTANYDCAIGVERDGAMGLYHRTVRLFDRTRYNVLALLQKVLNELQDEELELEPAQARDMARRLGGTFLPPQGRKGELHNH